MMNLSTTYLGLKLRTPLIVLSLIGGIGGSLTLLSYNYLLREEGRVDPRNLRAVRLDRMTFSR